MVADALRRLDTEMSHLTFSPDAMKRKEKKRKEKKRKL
jgi:hypothetical protein